MDENEVLGISAHFDLGDFEKTFETLTNKLTSVGTITEQVSCQMQKALNDLGNTSDKEVRKKAQESLQKFIDYISTAKDAAEEKVGKIAGTIEKLQAAIDKLTPLRAEMVIDSQEFNQASEQLSGLEKQLENQRKSLEAAKEQASLLTDSYNELANAMSTIVDIPAPAPQQPIAPGGSSPFAPSPLGPSPIVTPPPIPKDAVDTSEVEALNKELEKMLENFSPIGEELESITVKTSELKDKTIELVEAAKQEGTKESLQEAVSSAEQWKAAAEGTVEKVSQAEQQSSALIEKVQQYIQLLLEKSHEFGDAGNIEKVQEYDQKITELAGALKRLIEFNQGTKDSMREAANEAEQAAVAFEGLKDGLDKVTNVTDVYDALMMIPQGVKEALTGGDKLQESIDGFREGLNMLPAPLKNAVGGISKMGKAMWAMVQTPVGMVLAGIVIALKALFTWFNKSAEGQRVYAKLSAYVGSILSTLTDILVKLGGYLYHAFADANGPMHDFAANLVNWVGSGLKSIYYQARAVVNAFKALFTTLNAIENGFDSNLFSQAGDYLEQAGKDFTTGITNGVEAWKSAWQTVKTGFNGVGEMTYNVLDKLDKIDIGGSFKNMLKDAETAATIAGRKIDNENEALDVKEKNQERDAQIAELTDKLKHADDKEREELYKQVRELTAEKADAEIAQRRKALDLMQAERKLHSWTLEDLDREQVARTQILALEARKAAALRQVANLNEKEATKEERAEAVAKRKEEREKKAEERKAKAAARAKEREAKRTSKMSVAEEKATRKRDDVESKNLKARVDEAKELEDKLAEARIAAMKNGAAKERAQREYDNKKELQQIAQQWKAAENAERERQRALFEANQAIRASRGLKPVQWEDSMFNQQAMEETDKMYREYLDFVQERQRQDEINRLSEEYKDYVDERIEIEEKFNSDLVSLRKERDAAEDKGDKETAERLTRSIAKAERDKGLALMQVSMKQLKESPDYVRAFEDLNNASTETLEHLINEFDKAKEAAANDLDPKDLIEYTNAIEKMQEALIDRDPFEAFKRSTERVAEAQKKLDEARQRVETIRQFGPIVKSYKRNESGEFEFTFWTLESAAEAVKDAENELTKEQNTLNKAFAGATKVVSELVKEFDNVGKAIGGVAGEIISFIGDIANFAISTITTLKDTTTALAAATSSTMKAIEKASVILTVIASAISLFSKLQSFLPTADSMYEKAAAKQAEINKLTRAVHEYRLAVLESQQAENNWFATDRLTSLSDAYIRHGEVVKSYYDKLGEAQERYKNKSAGIAKALPYVAAIGAIGAAVLSGGSLALPALGSAISGGLLTGFSAAVAGGVAAGLTGAVAGAALQAGASAITYSGNQVAAVDNLRMQTRHKTFFRSEKTQDLRDWVRENLGAELFDEDGLINLQAAQVVLEKYGDKLVGQTRETLEELVDLRKQYDEFIDQIRDYVSNLYSPLVDNMTDALWDWLNTGTDVLARFKENAHSTFASIAKDMVRQMLLNGMFKQYSEMLEEVYKAYAIDKDPAKLLEGILSATDIFLDNAENELPVFQEALEKISEFFAERGFDITGGGSSSGSGAYRAVSSFSQEQGDELNGRLTAIQIAQQTGNAQRQQILEVQTLMMVSVVQLREYALTNSSNIEQMREIQFDSLRRLTEIRDYTSVLPEMATDIRDMRNDIKTKL